MPNESPSHPRAWTYAARYAPALIIATFAIRLCWSFATGYGFNVVDLHVYVEGAASLTDGRLYDFVYTRGNASFPLPFTYPPFAAILFYPLHYVPFIVVGVGWNLLIVAALYCCIRVVLGMLLGAKASQPAWRANAALWTVIGMWTEPVRATLDYGQINVFLMLCGLLAIRSNRWWVSGGLVGVAAGIKLMPAITGLFFLLRRRWTAAAFAAAVFALTIAISYLIGAKETIHYFGDLLGDPKRIGPVAAYNNQSLRGGLSHVAGYELGQAWWLCAVAAIAALGYFAWRALPAKDLVGTMLIVQIFGLLISPISWSHHFVWLIPVMLWLCYGPVRSWPGARIFAGYWLVVTVLGLPWIVDFLTGAVWRVPLGSPLAWAGSAYTLGAIALYCWIIRNGRTAATRAEPDTELATAKSAG